MFIIWLLIVGLIAGGLARLLVPGRDPIGIVGTIVLGVLGAIIGGLVARALFNRDGVGIIGATIMAVILLLIYNAVTRRKGAGTDVGRRRRTF